MQVPQGDWLELLPEAALLVDVRGAVVDRNGPAAALLGPDVLTPAWTLTSVNGLGAWLEGSGPETFEGRLQARRPNGVPFTVTLRARRLADRGGAVCLLVEPDRGRIAYEAQRYFDIAFDAAPIGMALFDTDGEYVRVNASLCLLLGRTEAEVLEGRDQAFTHPEDRQRDVDAAWRILRGELQSWQCEKRFLRPDGTVAWAIANLTFLRDEEGNPISWVGQFQDISERKRHESALQDALSLVAATLDATADGVVVSDPDGRLTSFNRRFAEMWRVPQPILDSGDGAAVLSFILDHLRDPEAFEVTVHQLQQHPEVESHHVLELLDGRVFELTAKPRRVGGEIVGRVWSVNDATDRKRLEANVASALAQAQEASRLKSAFVANVSHEIRTPMNGVLGLSELLLDSELDATQRSQLLALRESGKTLMALLNDVLDFSKIEAGKLELEEIDFDLAASVRSVAGIVSSRACDKGLELAVQLDDGVPAWVRGDPLRLRQVLLNLVSNAVKFTDCGTVTLVVTRLGDRRLRFSVADTGIGIDASVRHVLLDPFAQADSSTTRRFGGTGLGLAICAQLVELMGGTFEFDSCPGQGSTFWFDLPMTAARPSAAGAPSSPTLASGVAGQGLAGARVLLADDAPINRLVGVAMLERLGYLVDVVANGAEAVDAVQRNRYHAVLMDCLMPVMDGYEATDRIRHLEHGASRTPIIALTASAMTGDREKCIGAGMDDYLSKPLDPSALAGALARWRLAS